MFPRQLIIGCLFVLLAPAGHADFAAPFLEGFKAAETSPLRSDRAAVGTMVSTRDGWYGTSFSLEHALRVLPNFRLEHYQHSYLSVGAGGDAWRSVELGTGFDSNSATDASVDQIDATLYYPVMASFVNVDLGVNLKRIDTSVRMDQRSGGQTRNYTATFPMLYANALFRLPFQGLSAGVEGSVLDYDSNRLMDYRAKLTYETRSSFGMQGGWRTQQYSLGEADGLSPSLELQGPYLDLYLRF
ncbi:MAG: hypothetical protein AMJ69_01545 [Gammaproteobacteria bacterium SG8_47]|nr:MAG: hypothetical protein AMJ69_01545 [Gammaproteobacteria bacterium SG8_47]